LIGIELHVPASGVLMRRLFGVDLRVLKRAQ